MDRNYQFVSSCKKLGGVRQPIAVIVSSRLETQVQQIAGQGKRTLAAQALAVPVGDS